MSQRDHIVSTHHGSFLLREAQHVLLYIKFVHVVSIMCLNVQRVSVCQLTSDSLFSFGFQDYRRNDLNGGELHHERWLSGWPWCRK